MNYRPRQASVVVAMVQVGHVAVSVGHVPMDVRMAVASRGDRLVAVAVAVAVVV
jgi:hypothetical protein